MDEADYADLEIQNRIVIARHEAKKQSTVNGSKIRPVGECHFCGQEFRPDSPKLYCDNICADKHHEQIKCQR